MKKLLAILVLACAGCSGETLIVVTRLEHGDGGQAVTDRPQLDVVVRLWSDSTNFNGVDLMRVLLDGVDRTDEVVLGGTYGVLRIDPAPLGLHLVELARRTGPIFDTFTWDVQPYTGPTLASVAPASAQTGTQVTIAGAGFGAGALRVFFGGVEGTVDASSDTSITASVPAGAVPGLVWVRVGPQAAEGVVEFQPLDAGGAPLPAPTTMTLFAAFGGRTVGSVVKVYGLNFDTTERASFNTTRTDRLIDVQTVTLPLVGDILSGFVVINTGTTPGADELFLEDLDDASLFSNRLPFTVE